jgi:hypothetical protein
MVKQALREAVAQVRGRETVLNYALSISNGRVIIVDTMQLKSTIQPFLEQLRALPFVTDLDFYAEGRRNDREVDGILKIRAPKGTYRFLVEQKRSYLDRGMLNALVAHAKHYATEHRDPLLLFARYIPGPSAERLMQSGINFVDQAGNMHLVLGRNYERTVVGAKQTASGTKDPRISPAISQLLFAFATAKDAGSWSVRKLAEFAGLGKSNVAKVEQQLVAQGVLIQSEEGFRLRDRSKLPEELLRGYELALRPKLLLGRFRSPAGEIDEMLVAIRDSLTKDSIRWSITGGPAAYLLQKFYRGLELPIFIESLSDQLRRRLRIIPDKSGPLIFLRSFGSIPFWRESGSFPIAHPSLIYSELMYSSDPRAHEAAEEIKREYLSE